MFKKDKMSNSDLNAVRSQDSGYLRDRGDLRKHMVGGYSLMLILFYV